MAWNKFKDVIKTGFTTVTERYVKINIELKKMLKENKDYLKANQDLGKEAREAIASLRSYAENEAPGLQSAFVLVSEAMDGIEKNRGEYLAGLQEKFIAPLESIDEAWKKLQTELNEDDAAQRALKKANADLEKARSKPPEKVKPGEIEQAEVKVRSAEEKAEREHEDVVRDMAKFTELKLRVFKDVLEALLDLQTEFYEISLDIVAGARDKLATVDMDAGADLDVDAGE